MLFPFLGQPSGDPYFSDVVLLLPGNGTDGSTTIPDESSHGNTVTANGNAQIDTSQWKFNGSSIQFDGSGDYLSIPSASGSIFDPDGTFGDLTLEAFVRINSTTYGGAFGCIIGKHDNASARSFLFGLEGAGVSVYYYNGVSGLTATIFAGVGSLSINTWYHVALTRLGNLHTLWINGVSAGTNTSASRPGDNACPLTIGGTNAYSIDGRLAEVRFTQGVARYTAAFTPPTQPFPTF